MYDILGIFIPPTCLKQPYLSFLPQSVGQKALSGANLDRCTVSQKTTSRRFILGNLQKS